MTFQLPEDLKALDAEKLSELLDQAAARAAELLEHEADLTTDELDELDALGVATDAVEAEQAERDSAETARAERVAAAKERFAKPEVKADEAKAEDAKEDEDVDTSDVPDDASELIEEPEAVAASAAAKRKQTLAKAASKVPAPKAPAEEEKDMEPSYSLIAAGDVPGKSAGTAFSGWDELLDSYVAKVDSFVEGHGQASFTNRFPIAKMHRVTDPKLTITRNMNSDEAAEVLKYAVSESRLQGNSLVASGGWAAPSQIIYDIPIVEEAPDGILSIPEITVQRGGFQHTLGIDFGAAIYNNANFGFTQTETQAAAKTVKPFFEPTDPTFQDERLQVIGYGMRAGFLTLQGYPELIKRVAAGSVTAFAHYKNRDRINRLLAYFTAPTGTQATIGSLTHSILDQLAFNRRRLIHKNFLTEKATFQAMVPFWLLDVMREDLAKRQGWDAVNVPDSYIMGLFGSRGIAVQWVRDWTAQDLSGSATAYPATVEIAMWYAGTFVAASGSVVSFDALYDYAGVSTNTYTAFFNEESVLVARMNPVDAIRLTFDTSLINREGRTGKDDLGFNNTGRTA